ncbi:MAG: Rrf2 family transcriptional regulator [Phycisphaeraceae bacterium]|nr:Rrf2 family transcriptional regulator [Phycisphaeraceae bacterium]
MPLTQTAEYALRAAVCLAHSHDALVPTAELALRAGVPQNYLAKVLQTMAGAEIITGRRGVGGGYRLAREPASITLIEVVRAVGDLGPGGKHSFDPEAATGLCALHRLLDDERTHLVATLGRTTLGELLASGARVHTADASHRPKTADRLPSAP